MIVMIGNHPFYDGEDGFTIDGVCNGGQAVHADWTREMNSCMPEESVYDWPRAHFFLFSSLSKNNDRRGRWCRLMVVLWYGSVVMVVMR